MIIQFGELKVYPGEQALQTVSDEQAEQPTGQGTQELVEVSLQVDELQVFSQNDEFNKNPVLQLVHTDEEVQAEQPEGQGLHLLVAGFL